MHQGAKTMTKTSTFSFRLRDPYAEALEEVAEAEGELRSTMCERMVKWYLSENPENLDVLA